MKAPRRMPARLKQIVKKIVAYVPLSETSVVRETIERVYAGGMAHTPPDEGDLLFSLIRENGFRRCLELGFHTGSSALYMATAVADSDGNVASVCLDDDDAVARARRLFGDSTLAGRHRVVQENSNRALPRMFLAGERFDFVFMDGWKTYDHLAFEAYLVNRMLDRGGVLVLDDTHMPSVRRLARLLRKFYGYEEIDYARFNQTLRLRIFHVLTRGTLYRPYRAFRKTVDTEDQLPSGDWRFDRPI